MTERPNDAVDFDDRLTLALAQEADAGEPAPEVRARLMARVRENELPQGFSFRLASEDDWLPHPVPGIRMKVLAMDRRRSIATLLLDVAPGTVFPAHHHGTDEECYVISGTLMACGRTIGPGDFHHADGGSDHGELRTETGCQVLLVTEPEEYMPGYAG